MRHAVWLYFRFSLSLRDVEEMLAQRNRGQLRNDPVLDAEVRAADREAFEEAATGAFAALASG